MAVITDQSTATDRPTPEKRDPRTRSSRRPLVLNLLSVGLGIGIWWVLALAGLKLPTPPEVVSRAVELISDGTLGTDVLASLTRVLVGFALGTAVAIPVGFLMGWYAIGRALVEPWIQFFRTIPPLAIIPLAIVLLGIGEAPKIFVIFLAAFLACVISTFQGVVDVDRTPGPGQVYDVNSYALAAAARDAGADVNRVGIASTDPKRLREVVEGQLIRAEIVVIAGAVGGGALEEVREALSDLGEMGVERIAMHPGSVQGFGRLGRDEVPTFLLPANPVSALVVFEVMVRPLIRIALGRRQPMRRVVSARTVAPITSIPDRKGFLRGRLMRDETTGDYLVQALGGAAGSSSHLLATLAEANCLVIVDPEVSEIRTGDPVDVAFLGQRG